MSTASGRTIFRLALNTSPVTSFACASPGA
jgi:hypothetical protein